MMTRFSDDRLQEMMDRSVAATNARMESGRFVDANGNNYTEMEVMLFLEKSVGRAVQPLDHIPVGGIYENGSIWFQRMYNA